MASSTSAPADLSPLAPPPAFSSSALRPLAAALTAALFAACALKFFPALELAFFARGAAELAGLFTGMPVHRIAEGWLLPSADLPVAVTAACSATDFFLMLVALLVWQFARRGHHGARAFLVGLLTALPLALLLNALRVVTVTQAHRWVIPLLPECYGAFLHMFTGVAIFLPSLIALNLLLESHGNTRSSPPAST